MRRTRRTIQMVAILAAALICGFALYIALVLRVETRIEKDGWLLCFSNTRATPRPGSGRVERFEYKGRPVPVPATQTGRADRHAAVLLSCPVGLLVFENPRDGWRVMSARKDTKGGRAIRHPDTEADISETELTRGYYSLPRIHQLQLNGNEMTAAVLRKKGTPENWCLVTYESEGGTWFSPEVIDEILQGASTATSSSPS